MSTAPIASSSLSQQLQQYFQTRNSDLQQLGQALQQGDLAAAQTAYNNIVTLGQSGPAANGNPFLNSQREQDFQAIGQALQAGDLSSAQQAFAALRNTAQGQAGPTANSESGPGPEIVLNLSSNGVSPTAEQITLDLNPTAGGGEQLTIGLGSQGSSPQQQITLNLGAYSNEEIVLNLLGNSSASNASGGTGLNLSA